jgi:O-acetyl-ADP-ribose deacetylase (regulator of RNase III)
MIEVTRGNILEADAEAIVNAVNCVGVMGRGIALQFRKAYPESFPAYKAACNRKELEPGKVLTHVYDSDANLRYIIHFPTKVHWKGNSRLSYIEKGLEALVKEVEQRSIRSIALPALGCGLGGLDWTEVRTRIETAFAALPEVRVLLYEPGGTSP